MQVGGEMWRTQRLYDIMDGKSDDLLPHLEQDPELKKWRCKQSGECAIRCRARPEDIVVV